MATKYLALLTNIGAAKLAKATALGTKVEITQLAVGDGNGVLPTPNPAQTALVHELRRAPLNMLTVDPANGSQIIAEQVIPEDVGGWWIREIGLFDKDGDMVAIANCAETYKPQLQEGSGRVQVIRVILIVSSTEAVTLKIDPAVVLATRQYVDSQLRAHEQSRNHPDASTTEKGFVQLSSSVTSDSESQAATSKAVKIAMDNGSARLAKDRNLSDLPNTALARQNLELGDSSTRNVGTTAGTVASGDDARITGAMQKSQNGGDIPDVAKFLQNLGLQAFISHPSNTPGDFTQVNSPDDKKFIFIANDGAWGAQSEDGSSVPLPVSFGGTGANSASQALDNFGIGPIASSTDISNGTAKKLVDAQRLIGAIATDADIQNKVARKFVDAYGLINAITTMQDVQDGALRKFVNALTLKNYLPAKPLSGNGYIRIPDIPGGTIIQFGQVGMTISEGAQNVVLPTPFPNFGRFAIAIPLNTGENNSIDIFAQLKGVSTTSATFFFSWASSSTPADGFQWFAIGY
ncbi:phage tail protein [Enterobacter asburiae]|uniref:phage tail protein n=1 Tax=Enterobacter asburiae TaxID=61645 RepID=UPI002879CF26|nr:phage tail protein [Enterobacter asburiae]MDS1915403.1 phage tail protein [Enterobacter asburiae]